MRAQTSPVNGERSGPLRIETRNGCGCTPWYKAPSTIIAFLCALGALLGTVWVGSALVNGKADRSELAPLERSVGQIQTDIALIRNHLRRVVFELDPTYPTSDL